MSASNISHVTLVSTEDRKPGVESSIRALEINPAKNKDVLIKPNFNTADQCPGSTHNDTLVALVEEVWKMGAKSVRLGERSYSENRSVMEQKGIIPLMEKLDVNIIDFDELDEKDWVKVDADNSHWQDGFRVAIDAVGVAILKSLGSNDQIMNTKIFDQEQIARAVELGLGASSPSEIEVIPADEKSCEYRDRVVAILNAG